ncbi:MAG: hypothetical protein M0R76_13005 [Proteobacteria bacterium]|nr:hypothetical protein [Pseudomonadota bacterium]
MKYLVTMRLERRSLEELRAAGTPVIGFWGMPPQHLLRRVAAAHPGVPFYDLDVDYGAPRTAVLPDAYCHIIRNCVDNALGLGPQLVCLAAATGDEKCDAARFAARLLKDMLHVPVLASENTGEPVRGEPLLCQSLGRVKHRAVRIMESVIEPLSDEERAHAQQHQCQPTHGFWGTPPHPIGVLDLFPETTHIFGWTRVVELGQPADLDAEMYVPDGLPTVFFAQGFCPKALLARSLAAQHRGMFVDVHDTLNAATRAKIEAFIRLTGGSL